MKETPAAQNFTAEGDRLFDAFASRFSGGPRRRLLVGQPLDPAAYARVRLAAAGFIGACLGKTDLPADPELSRAVEAARKTLPNLTPNGLLLPKREHVLEFNLIQRAVADLFLGLPLADQIDGIQLPINLRIVGGRSEAAVDSRAYATAKLHTDVWTGEPPDAAIVQLPLFGDIENITMRFSELARDQERRYMRAYEDYSAASLPEGSLTPYDVGLAFGSIYFFDCRLPHRTVRTVDRGVRVSIDLRLRLKSSPAYRAFCDSIAWPQRLAQYVPWKRWLGVGRDALLVFDETCEQARQRHAGGAQPSAGLSPYRLVDLRP